MTKARKVVVWYMIQTKIQSIPFAKLEKSRSHEKLLYRLTERLSINSATSQIKNFAITDYFPVFDQMVIFVNFFRGRIDHVPYFKATKSKNPTMNSLEVDQNRLVFVNDTKRPFSIYRKIKVTLLTLKNHLVISVSSFTMISPLKILYT